MLYTAGLYIAGEQGVGSEQLPPQGKLNVFFFPTSCLILLGYFL